MPRYRNHEWVSHNEWRQRKRAAKKRQLEWELQKTAEQAEKSAAYHKEEVLRRERAKSVRTRLWAWGVNSERHPTNALGLFPMLIMYLVAVPIFGVLYKLSFSFIGPLMIIGGAAIAALLARRPKP